MILALFLGVCAYNMKLSPFKSFNENYLSRETTTSIKGIFVFLVFMSHFAQYYPIGTVPGDSYYYIKRYTGQLIVTMFLFYSGYGILESIKRKGTDYVKAFPKNRLLKTLLHFAIAIVIYLVLNIALGKEVKPINFLLALTGWTSIGNSNWFMFTIFFLYIAVFLAFIVFRKHHLPAIITVTAITLAYTVFMKYFKEPYWYNTAMCLPLGMWYSYLKQPIEKFVMKNNITYYLILAADIAAILIGYKFFKRFMFYELKVASFTAFVILISMKINFNNKALIWLGNHVFSVYILQRIPMIIFTKLHIDFFGDVNLCFAVCFITTILISGLFDKAMSEIDKRLFKTKKKPEAIKEKVSV